MAFQKGKCDIVDNLISPQKQVKIGIGFKKVAYIHWDAAVELHVPLKKKKKTKQKSIPDSAACLNVSTS